MTGAIPVSFRIYLRPSKARDPSGPSLRLRREERRSRCLSHAPLVASVPDAFLFPSATRRQTAVHDRTRVALYSEDDRNRLALCVAGVIRSVDGGSSRRKYRPFARLFP